MKCFEGGDAVVTCKIHVTQAERLEISAYYGIAYVRRPVGYQ
jgi:hypothetical protein